MGISQDHHRRCAEECVAMARAASDENGKVLWLTLALSWVRLAEHVAQESQDRVSGIQDRVSGSDGYGAVAAADEFNMSETT
jgi:hypothetical protein